MEKEQKQIHTNSTEEGVQKQKASHSKKPVGRELIFPVSIKTGG
jgi:hypothetical protein